MAFLKSSSKCSRRFGLLKVILPMYKIKKKKIQKRERGKKKEKRIKSKLAQLFYKKI